MAPAKWNFEAEYIQSCNCDYGCPCNFNGLPTYGNCEALLAWRIRKGTYEGTKLDGVTFALGCWWPRAIHQGGGVGAYYIQPSATPEQRQAIEAICSGQHGGGVFEIFPKTWTKTHAPKAVPIEFHYAEYGSWFKVEGIGEVHSEKIKNPVSKDEFTGSIDLPGGIAFKTALVSSIRRWWVRDDDILAIHENKNGHVAVVKFSEKGCVG